uniref:Myb/SANT-like DNA-binding domain-containing protein n=1 Tax=Timema bartmani TaxID=61472 RepID=A0A7R9I5E3_9NEOP|nr:unnamed protein product [Timema bartmani]
MLGSAAEVDHTTEGSLEPDFDSNNSDELESDVDGEEHSTPIWSDSASRLLISLYSSHIELVGSENVRTMKQMWQQVAEAMRQEGYNYTNFQVENRWKTFRRSFKRKLKSGTTLGGRTVRCPFERELEPLLGDQQRKTETNNETPSGQDQQGPLPEYSDILWVSSEEQSVEDEEEAEEPAPPTDPKYIAKGHFKRKRQCISQVLNQMKETMATNERNKHKRHKEKMALLREKNEILQMNNALLKDEDGHEAGEYSLTSTLCNHSEDGHEAGEYSLTSTLCNGSEDGHEAGEYSLTSTLCNRSEDGHEAGEYSLTSTLCNRSEDGHEAGEYSLTSILCNRSEDGHEAGEYSLTSTLCNHSEDDHEAGEYSFTSTLCNASEDGHEAGEDGHEAGEYSLTSTLCNRSEDGHEAGEYSLTSTLCNRSEDGHEAGEYSLTSTLCNRSEDGHEAGEYSLTSTLCNRSEDGHEAGEYSLTSTLCNRSEDGHEAGEYSLTSTLCNRSEDGHEAGEYSLTSTLCNRSEDGHEAGEYSLTSTLCNRSEDGHEAGEYSLTSTLCNRSEDGHEAGEYSLTSTLCNRSEDGHEAGEYSLTSTLCNRSEDGHEAGEYSLTSTLCNRSEDGHEAGEYSLTSTLCNRSEDGHEAGEYSLTSTLCNGSENGHEAGEYSLTSTLCNRSEDGHEAGEYSLTTPESPLLESRNWLIHIHYCRREFDVCRMYIQEELERSSRMAEYPNYIMGITDQAHGIVVSAPGYELSSPRFDSQLVPQVIFPKVELSQKVSRVWYLLGRHRLAVEAYLEAEAVATKPDWAIYHNLGLCLVHVGEQAKAKDNFLRALQCSRQEETYMALAKIHLLEDDIEGAIWIYKTALQCYGDSAELSTALGLLYMKTGQFQSAFEQLGSALAHDSNCPRALLAAATMMQDFTTHARNLRLKHFFENNKFIQYQNKMENPALKKFTPPSNWDPPPLPSDHPLEHYIA